MTSTSSSFSRLTSKIIELLRCLTNESSLSIATKAGVDDLREIYDTPLIRDKISSVFIPFIYRLRERVRRVINASSDKDKLSAVGYFASEDFLRAAIKAITDECETAARESEIAKAQGLSTRLSGFPLLLVSRASLDREIIPRASTLLCAMSELASNYHPRSNRAIERYMVRFNEMIEMIEEC